MSAQIKLRRDTAANWTSVNPILATGEPGLETDTLKLKYGDGVRNWNALSYPTVLIPNSVASATTATNLAGGVTSQILVQTGTGITGFITAPTIPGFLQWTGSSFTWSSTSTVAAAQTLTGSILAPNVTTAAGLITIGTVSVLTTMAGNLTVTGTTTHTGTAIFNNTSTFNNTLTVSTGGLVVTLGGATVTAGGLTVNSGGITITGTSSITGNTTITGTANVVGALRIKGVDFKGLAIALAAAMA
jgi:hypothetical protein